MSEKAINQLEFCVHSAHHVLVRVIGGCQLEFCEIMTLKPPTKSDADCDINIYH